MRKAIVVVLLLLSLTLSACTPATFSQLNNLNYEIITDADDLPQAVSDVLENTKMERGYYLFSSSFTGEETYAVLCGGEEYPDGYSIQIEDYEYRGLLDDPSIIGSPGGNPPMSYVTFTVDVSEHSSAAGSFRCRTTDLPYTVIRFSSKYSFDWLNIRTNSVFPLINWRSAEVLQTSTSALSLSVIQNNDSIPYDLKNHIVKAPIFTNPSYTTRFRSYANEENFNDDYSWDDCDALAIYIVAKENEQPFSVSIEEIEPYPFDAMTLDGTRLAQFDLVLRKRYVKTPLLQQGDLSYALIIVKDVQGGDRPNLSDMYIIDDQLYLEFCR